MSLCCLNISGASQYRYSSEFVHIRIIIFDKICCVMWLTTGYVSDCGWISDAWQSSVSIIADADAQQSPPKHLSADFYLPFITADYLAVWTYDSDTCWS